MTPEQKAEQAAEQLLAAITNLQSRMTLVEELLKSQRAPLYVVNPIDCSPPGLLDISQTGGPPTPAPLHVVYYDVNAEDWRPMRAAEPFPFKHLYRAGQRIVDQSTTWIVVQSWVVGSVYRVLCSKSMPYWMASEILNNR